MGPGCSCSCTQRLKLVPLSEEGGSSPPFPAQLSFQTLGLSCPATWVQWLPFDTLSCTSMNPQGRSASGPAGLSEVGPWVGVRVLETRLGRFFALGEACPPALPPAWVP